MSRSASTLTDLARLGFAGLGEASGRLEHIPEELDPARLVPLFALAADPDQALRLLLGLLESAPTETAAVLADATDGESGSAASLVRVLGASEGLAAFLGRHPEHLDALCRPITDPGEPAPIEASGTGSGPGMRCASRTGASCCGSRRGTSRNPIPRPSSTAWRRLSRISRAPPSTRRSPRRGRRPATTARRSRSSAWASPVRGSSTT
ncbi:hypothetical protein GCM10025881_36550 [Pseudolysinimonas kribbensis]|uniref:Bifunctional glutamine-synthetase adenylyltransferase/deadenyltransferase n=1 Tax=Pseudolysinimonas kribbensis TaxID=433641 RepID=A0ABQ6KF22_9MICO|nr:hypothetical protein GCM10025881_36550 [Pseudolysinimonas kribbensis]